MGVSIKNESFNMKVAVDQTVLKAIGRENMLRLLGFCSGSYYSDTFYKVAAHEVCCIYSNGSTTRCSGKKYAVLLLEFYGALQLSWKHLLKRGSRYRNGIFNNKVHNIFSKTLSRCTGTGTGFDDFGDPFKQIAEGQQLGKTALKSQWRYHVDPFQRQGRQNLIFVIIKLCDYGYTFKKRAQED